MAIDVSVIIVNWNARAFLRDCLRSIAEQTRRVSCEVIVVDNASNDESGQMVKAEFPHVTLIENLQNRGFAAANNQGIRLSAGRYILLLNPDTVVLDGALDRMVEYCDAHPDVGCAGCQVLENETAVQMTCFRFPSPLNLFLSLSGLSRAFPGSRLFDRYWLGWWDRSTQRDVDVVSGMFMMVRREVVERVGFMDEDYFVYAEEADWCYRIWKAGWRCVFTPVARIIHREGGGKSTSQINRKMYIQQQKSLLLFHRKNLGRGPCLAARMLFVGFMAARACVLSAACLLSGKRPGPAARNAFAALGYHLSGREVIT